MNLSDTFYVALCMTVLILGVVYWFWTQNQYIQRKLNLLENIVYEMKSAMHSAGPPDIVEKVLAHAHDEFTPIESLQEDLPETENVEDILQELSETTLTADSQTAPNVGTAVTAPAPEVEGVPVEADEVVDLQPGGVGSGAGEDVGDLNSESVLNGMGLKELKALATQKGVAGAKNMRKQDLVAAIRASKTTVTPFEVHEGTLSLN